MKILKNIIDSIFTINIKVNEVIEINSGVAYLSISGGASQAIPLEGQEIKIEGVPEMFLVEGVFLKLSKMEK